MKIALTCRLQSRHHHIAVTFALALSIIFAASFSPSLSEASDAGSESAFYVSVTEAKDTITRGSTQTIYVVVRDADNRPVDDAKIHLYIISGSNSDYREITSKTGEAGKWSYSWYISQKAKVGLVGADIQVSKPGFSDGYGSAIFKVIPRK